MEKNPIECKIEIPKELILEIKKHNNNVEKYCIEKLEIFFNDRELF